MSKYLPSSLLTTVSTSISHLLLSNPHISLCTNLQYNAVREFLKQHQWPTGLQDTMLRQLEKYPTRYFLVDDSGSMTAGDGNKVVGDYPNHSLVPCTRWSELVESMKFHAKLAEIAEVRRRCYFFQVIHFIYFNVHL